MITTLYDLEVALRDLGYSKMKEQAKHKKTYFKVESINSEHVCKIVVCIDLLGAKVLTSEGVDIVKGIAATQFEGVNADDVLVIALDKKGTADVSGNNIIFYNRENLKLHGKVSELYTSELSGLKEGLKERKRKETHMKALWDYAENNHSTTAIYLLIGLIIWMQMCYTGKNTDMYGISAFDVYKNGQSYRLFTYLFTHAGFAHMLSNCTSLFVIGRTYARRRGFLDVLIVFLGGGVLAGTASITLNMVTYRPEAITVGASGAIFAVLGALLVNVFMDASLKGRRKNFVKYAAITLVLSSIGGSIDNVCHIAGFICGGLLEFILAKADKIYAYTKFIESRDKTRTSF